MKLYYSAGSCSSSCLMILEESGLKYEAIAIDWDQSSDPNVALVSQLNPLGTLPILITDEGRQLDQNLSIHCYIADQSPKKNLLPPFGTIERAEAMNWLSFVAADLHKSIGALFSLDSISSEQSVQHIVRRFMVERANECLKYVDIKLQNKEYLMGTQFTPADAYAFVVIGWTKYLEIPIISYKNIQAYLKRVASRPAIARVLKLEGMEWD